MPGSALKGPSICSFDKNPQEPTHFGDYINIYSRIYYLRVLRMGGGASSLNRLRKTLLLRAYNLRSEDMTLEEQFSPFAYAIVTYNTCICVLLVIG